MESSHCASIQLLALGRCVSDGGPAGFIETRWGVVGAWTGVDYTHFHLMHGGYAYGYTARRSMTARQMVYWAGRLMQELISHASR